MKLAGRGPSTILIPSHMTASLSRMRRLLSSYTWWRMLKAAMFLVALTAPLALAPAATAHNSLDTNASLAISTAGSGLLAVSDNDPGATIYVQSAAWTPADADDSCPNERDHSHSDHSGCCAGVICCIASCVAACGAMSPPEDPIKFLSAETALRSSATPLSVGIDTIPTDPPPRLSI
jgi:hypothetical protein